MPPVTEYLIKRPMAVISEHVNAPGLSKTLRSKVGLSRSEARLATKTIRQARGVRETQAAIAESGEGAARWQSTIKDVFKRCEPLASNSPIHETLQDFLETHIGKLEPGHEAVGQIPVRVKAWGKFGPEREIMAPVKIKRMTVLEDKEGVPVAPYAIELLTREGVDALPRECFLPNELKALLKRMGIQPTKIPSSIAEKEGALVQPSLATGSNPLIREGNILTIGNQTAEVPAHINKVVKADT